MRWILLAVPVVIACVVALMQTQQKVLWDVTEPGMTVAEVRAVLPGAVPPASPRQLDNGLELGLIVPKVSNLERAFDAELYFREDALQQVVLRPTRLLAGPAAQMEFDELRQAASRRYGRELPADATTSTGRPDARWRAGPVTIVLRVEEQGSLAAITMSYTVTKDRS